ncbi:phosphoribosyltransferase family protein [Aliiglaciecola sp. CAU 1673]|uniref:phosphoribosyltransferase n=1 Tax=Aliiglaciecola sp. CAU 1673 TaxID=3032595 RepID=UPI0031F438D2
MEEVAQKEQAELARRQQRYCNNKPWPDISEKVVILVDDGIATGATMLAAIKALKSQHPKELILAVPVAAKESLERLIPSVDKAICLHTPHPFYAVGRWYQEFDAVSDEKVLTLLCEAN